MKIKPKINKRAAIAILSCIIMASVIFLNACSFSSDNKTSVNNTASSGISQAAGSGSNNVSANTSKGTVELAGTCPKNNSCSYPGKCGKYTDSNNNGLCDLGE